MPGRMLDLSSERGRWVALALFVSSSPLVVLAHGILGTGSSITAAILVLSTASLFAVGNWTIKLETPDICFFAFAGYLGLSLYMNPANPKEMALLAITLSCYPAGRLLNLNFTDPVFPKIVLSVVAAGAVFTVVALLRGSVDMNGKPKVFGELAAAPAQFMTPFVIAVGAIIARDKINFQWIPTLVIATMAAVFAASMVRFTFIAAIGAGIVLAFVSSKHVRRWAVVASAVLVIAIAVGQVSRPATAIKFKNFAAQAFSPGAATEDPCANLDVTNSIAIRMAFYRDWLRLIPESGLTGIGLNGFVKRSCYQIDEEEVHNDILQVALEFGWPAAGLFTFLLFASFIRLIRARNDERARFCLFALTFLVLMSMAHGRISRDYLLFFFVGYGLRVSARLNDTQQFVGDDRWLSNRECGR